MTRSNLGWHKDTEEIDEDNSIVAGTAFDDDEDMDTEEDASADKDGDQLTLIDDSNVLPGTWTDDGDDIPVGRCIMHFGGLAWGLAMSFVERRSHGVVINYWSPFRDLYKELLVMLQYIFDKKNKRFDKYRKALKAVGKEVIVVNLPNKTRVVGAMNVMQESLRSMFAMKQYATVCEKFEQLQLVRSKWRKLAEFEAVARPSVRICFSAQSNRPEAGGEIVLDLIDLKVKNEEKKIYDVVDTDNKEAWFATKQFKDLPTKKMTRCVTTAEKMGIP